MPVGWSEWSGWEACTANCSRGPPRGVEKRFRTCNGGPGQCRPFFTNEDRTPWVDIRPGI